MKEISESIHLVENKKSELVRSIMNHKMALIDSFLRPECSWPKDGRTNETILYFCPNALAFGNFKIKSFISTYIVRTLESESIWTAPPCSQSPVGCSCHGV